MRNRHAPRLRKTAPDRSGARIALRIKGFGAQSRVTTESIASALRGLPEFHLEGLQEIEYDPERMGQKATGYFLPPRVYTPLPNFRCAAEYLPDDAKIAVYEFDSEQSLYDLLFHEIGHHVCRCVISGAVRKRWVNQIHPSEPAVSPAGSRNALEDFAEAYALFVRNPERLRERPKKHAFFREEVFQQAP
jgi:hypothetical protein